MNRVVLVCAAMALLSFGGLLFMKNNSSRVVYIPGKQLIAPAPTIPHVDAPNVDQIKKDLGGKVVVVNGKSHQFAGPELNTLTIKNVNTVDANNICVDLQICADSTIVDKKGLLGMRRSYTHENVCGSMRVYYERKGDQWVYRMAENIDLQKALTPNAKAPPSQSQLYKIR